MITGYSVTYFCTDHSRPCGNQMVQVFGEDNKTFTASQLISRTTYTFEVRAFYNHSTNNFTVGPLANVTGVTKVPKGR